MNFREQLHKARFGPICNIGGSDSNSKSSSTTNNIDQRMAVDSNGTGVSTSGTGNTVTVQAVDHGAVAGAFGLGHDAIAAVVSEGTSALSASQHTAEDAINGVLQATANSTNAVTGMASRLDDAFQQNSSALASAYQDAKTGDQKTLMVGAFAVAAVALLAMAHRKA